MPFQIKHTPQGGRWRRISRITKTRTGGTGEEALRRLRAFLDAAEADVVEILARLWTDQRQAITYQEIRKAILDGCIDEQTAQEWMNDYAHFFNDKLRPKMEEAMREANAKLEAEHPGLFFSAHDPGVQDWLSTRGGELITVIGGEQRQAINAMIGRAYTGEWSVDELSRVIRPLIGLNRPQAIANLNYYESVKNTLLANNSSMRESTAAKRAREAAVKYAERQHRYRAFMIARTEMAFAYNRGMDEGIKQAIAKGYMGTCVRIWATSADERTCSVCGNLEGVEIGMDGEFDFSAVNVRVPSGPTPPAHPNCRCAVDYKEIAPPVYQDFSEWAAAPTPQRIESDEEQAEFTTFGTYLRPDGTFDVEKAQKDYEKFLQNAPEKSKLYLQQAMDAVEYEKVDLDDVVFAYHFKRDVLGYNPNHPMFNEYPFDVAITHELSHRVDKFFFRSWTVKEFSNAIMEIVQSSEPWEEHKTYCKANDTDGFLSDILAALCGGKENFSMGHEEEYFKQNNNREKEVFANLFSLETCRNQDKLNYLKKHFLKVYLAYQNLEPTL